MACVVPSLLLLLLLLLLLEWLHKLLLLLHSCIWLWKPWEVLRMPRIGTTR